jgi:hypothetical protein
MDICFIVEIEGVSLSLFLRLLFADWDNRVSCLLACLLAGIGVRLVIVVENNFMKIFRIYFNAMFP